MMLGNIINYLKQNKIHFPVWLGVLFAKIPYSWRPLIGKVYRQRIKQINAFENMSIQEQKDFIFRRMYDIVKYSIENIPFYKHYYSEKGFSIKQLNSYDDIVKIPIITKEELMGYDLKDRSNEGKEKLIVNTGGSSGKTLSFYIEPSAIAHEQAHAHFMWKELGFTQSSVRLMIIGRNHIKNGVEYDFARNGYNLDMYQSFDNNRDVLMRLLKKRGCDYIQGYPSVLAGFADYCQEHVELLRLIRNNLKGVFLISEFPYPIYRNKIESVFQVPSIAHYGHTERCVMAYEKKSEKNVYHIFQTYGFAEVKEREDGHFDLIGTAYYNYASPLIRYNTADIVDKPKIEDGILNSFEIIEGRSGQFITDSNGREVSLTGLIMGRHHPLFDCCEHIQVMQKEKGKATILYVPKPNVMIEKPENLFDHSNVDVEFDYMNINEPVRTKTGKVSLLVKENVDYQKNTQ